MQAPKRQAHTKNPRRVFRWVSLLTFRSRWSHEITRYLNLVIRLQFKRDSCVVNDTRRRWSIPVRSRPINSRMVAPHGSLWIGPPRHGIFPRARVFNGRFGWPLGAGGGVCVRHACLHLPAGTFKPSSRLSCARFRQKFVSIDTLPTGRRLAPVAHATRAHACHVHM